MNDAADLVAREADADVLFLNGPISPATDFLMANMCDGRNCRTNVLLILVTEGGDADAAYRIARRLQFLYQRFSLFVTGYCKSAGTLVGVGAHELVIADRGDLGPLDAQLRKEDELFQTRSGLTVLSALSTLHQQAFEAYEHFFLQTKLRSGGDITTKTAVQIATSLAGGLFGRVYEHIDAMHVGEAGRFLKIAHQYGQLLQRTGQNCKPDALDRLTTQYPSHGFTIDRFQAEDLFNNVAPPSRSQLELARHLGLEALRARGEQSDLLLTFLNTEQAQEQEHDGQTPDEDGSRSELHHEPDGTGTHQSRTREDSTGRLVAVGRAEG